MITASQWLQVLSYCGVHFDTAVRWAKVFEAHAQPEKFSRGAAELPDFTGQALYETDLLEHLEENLNYSAKRIREIGMRSPEGSRWRSLVPRADQLAGKPREFANAVYGGRLGNVGPDDGWLYRGGGIPMVTGLDNYKLLQRLTGLPLLEHPELIREPDGALRCGILWWESRVDDDAIGSVERVTAEVQGGQLGVLSRGDLTRRAGRVLSTFSL